MNTNLNIFDLPVHPSADLFPMLLADEIQELADDIADNGLIHPVVIKDGILIDGRNRLAACKIANHQPKSIELDGDIDSYIISSNINRRHMTKGQKAMAVAMIYPDAEKGGRGKKSVINTELNNGYISHARTIIKYAPDLSDNVLGGSKPLNDAYKTALQRKISAEEGDIAMDKLIEGAPDLVDLVKEERMELSEALAAMDARIKNDKANRIATVNVIKSFISDGESLLSGNKSRLKLLSGNRRDVEELLDCSIESAIDSIIRIKKSDDLINLLRGIK